MRKGEWDRGERGRVRKGEWDRGERGVAPQRARWPLQTGIALTLTPPPSPTKTLPLSFPLPFLVSLLPCPRPRPCSVCRIYQAIKTDIADLIKTPSSAPAAGRPAG